MPKLGSQEIQLDVELLAGSAADVPLGVAVWLPVVVGLTLAGRSIWSVGFPGGKPVSAECTMVVVVAAMVVVPSKAWSLSSSSWGIGSFLAFAESIDSPQSFRCQSIHVPVLSFKFESLTTTVHLP